jgi:hypothetical protein
VLTIITKAPNIPGKYILELDMVQEGVAWFGHSGSKTKQIDINVTPSWNVTNMLNYLKNLFKTASAFKIFMPQIMEMHGIKRSDVEELIFEMGCSVVEVVEDDRIAPGWMSCIYWVKKEAK